MRNKAISAIIFLTILSAITLYSGISHSTVFDTPHDLSIDSSGSQFIYKTIQVCVFCHTPHGANESVRITTVWNGSGYDQGSGDPAFLLWNRALNNATSYSTYKSSSMDSNTAQVRAYSLMCLSCHDGVSALNVLNSYPSDAPVIDPLEEGVVNGPWSMGEVCTGVVSNSLCDPDPNIGERVDFPLGIDDGIVNLANDHPVSIDYNGTALGGAHPDVLSGGLRDPNNIVGFVNVTSVRLFYSPVTGTLTSLECSSCHNVHDLGDQNLGTFPFLAASINESGLCRQCHLK